MHTAVFEIPRLRQLARHAVPNLLEATLIPLAVFYGVLAAAGMWPALGAALAWAYACVALRLVRRQKVPGILVLGTLAMTARTVVAVLSGSVFVYFLQPTLGTVAVAAAFLLSVPAGSPLAARLARDFCPLPDAFADHPHVQLFFRRISLLWGAVYLLHAGLALWMLLTQPLAGFLLAKTAASLVLTGGAIVLSTLWFRRTMARHGLQVRWAPRRLAADLPPAA